jgi:hypothetical protein
MMRWTKQSNLPLAGVAALNPAGRLQEHYPQGMHIPLGGLIPQGWKLDLC